MSYADQLFIQNCKDILENGVWDTDHESAPCGRTALLLIPSNALVL